MTAPAPQPDSRWIPSQTDHLLTDPRLRDAGERLAPGVIKRALVEAQRRAGAGEIDSDAVVDLAVSLLPPSAASARPVLNATGVVLHANLGRASLSSAAVDALVRAAGPTDVELDLLSGQRARRGRSALAALRASVPAAEAVAVVNNGAAALVLAATALASGREIVVSRTELVDVGDGLRLSDLIACTGARIRLVGTPHRTSTADYAAAIGPDTGCILKVQSSQLLHEEIESSVPVAALARLGPPVVVAVGSGLLVPDPLLPNEPDVDSALKAGASLVTASADKLMGGPQAGLVLGREDVVERLRRHPLARAIRVDKLALAALEATLRGPVSPTWNALRADPHALRIRAEALAAGLADVVDAVVVASDGVVGGGGVRGVSLPGWAVAVPEAYAVALRTGEPAVVGRLERGRCLIDLRCIPAAADAILLAAVRRVALNA